MAPRESAGFPLDLNIPRVFTSGNIEGLGETKLTDSRGASVLIVSSYFIHYHNDTI